MLTLNSRSTKTQLSALFCLALLFLFSGFTSADTTINNLNPGLPAPTFVDFDYLVDDRKSLSIQEIIAKEDSAWSRTQSSKASFGFNESDFWIKLGAVNSTPNTRNFILEIAYPILDEVDFYNVTSQGEIRGLKTGDTRNFDPRDVNHPSMLFRFQLAPNEQTMLYARISTKGSMILPVKVWQENHFFERAATEQKVHFFYFGSLFVIMLINFAVFVTLREKVYLFYSLATGGFLLFFISIRGYGLQLLFPNQPELSSQLFLSSMPILALFSLLFAREFLRTAEHSPRVDLALRGMIYFEYFNMVAAVALDYNTSVKISAVSAIVLFAVLFVAGPASWMAKRRSGMYFTIAWIPLTMGFAITAARSSGAIPHNFFTEYAMQIGSGLEAFILTLALAERLYREREKKINAQNINLKTEQERLAAQSQLAEVMMHDPITGLPNRSRFEWMADRTFTKRPDDKFAVGITKISRLEEITRTLGFDSSEQVLKAIAKRMKEVATGISDITYSTNIHGNKEAAFQLSGNTFGVLIQLTENDDMLNEYQAALQNLAKAIQIESLSIELEPQFGAALFPDHGDNAAQLIRNAHIATDSHTAHSTTIGYYRPENDIYNKSRLTLMTDLKEALQKNEPTLHYQPKQDLKTGRIIGIEALIRWHHPVRGFVSPADFIPLAEETGVIHDLTLWAFSRALKDFGFMRSKGYQGNISINISARDLLRKDISQQFDKLLNKYMVDPKRIFLELTETAAMEDATAGLAALNQLTSIGLKISIDDFGVGHSSLSYLKQLPASEIKLDRSLINDMSSDESSQIIVKTSIEMGHSLGYQVVAEGVEDEETCERLKELNCDKLQGFWLCKPLPLEDLMDWLKDRNP